MPVSSYEFGEFELDCARFELRRNGRALKLERIPMELLILLAEKGGHVVTRQEISERLWGKDVFVDTEHGINTAIRKIRTALREDADQPRFVQTVPGKGYRFVAERTDGSDAGGLAPPEVKTPVSRAAVAEAVAEKHRDWRPGAIALLALAVLAGAVLAFNVGGIDDRVFARSQVGPIHSLAVLPLANLSGDPAQDYYADGMTDELITALARNRSWRVVSRTSAMQYKGASRPLREIAQALGVDGILEGSVHPSASRVHINLQLIYAPTDTHMWAESYDRDLNEAMSLPEEVSRTIAKEAGVASPAARPQRYINPEAHDAYLMGRDFWFRGNRGRSTEYFEKAIHLQPDYAAAWDGIADAYGQAAGGEMPPREAFAEAWKYARKAVELDDSLPEGHNSLAAFYLFNGWDWPRAEAESLRAIQLNPNHAHGRHIHSYILLVTNRDGEALQEQKRADELDPFERPWALGRTYMWLRQIDAAINELRARAEVQPQEDGVQLWLSRAYWLKGMNKEAVQHLEQAAVAGGDTRSAEAIRHAFEQGGDRAVLQWQLNEKLKASKKKYVSPYDLAFDYARLKRKEETLGALEDACRERSPDLVFLQKEPVFDFLHSEPRYRAIVKNVGLPPAY